MGRRGVGREGEGRAGVAAVFTSLQMGRWLVGSCCVDSDSVPRYAQLSFVLIYIHATLTIEIYKILTLPSHSHSNP